MGLSQLPSVSNMPVTKVRRVATQSITSATQPNISWDTEDQDDLGLISVPSATFTIPAGGDGIWTVTYTVGMAGSIGSNRAFATINFVRAGIDENVRTPFGNGEDLVGVTGTSKLAAGDTFNADVFQSSGGPINVVRASLIATRLSL